MSLTKPNPGELYDRLCIVKLKISACDRLGRLDVQKSFIEELYELSALIQVANSDYQKYNVLLEKIVVTQHSYFGKKITVPNELMIGCILEEQIRLQKELQEIHDKLWNLEDNRRELIGDGTIKHSDYLAIVKNTVETTMLNNDRADLIKKINKLYGIKAVEKLYA